MSDSADLPISVRLDRIEASLRQLMVLLAEREPPEPAPAEDLSDWVDSTMFCRLAGIKNPHSLSYFMKQGVFTSKSVKNIGTEKKPRYKFHRRKAVDEFLNRTKVRL